MSMIASASRLGRQHERVGHHEAALGIGVDDLDRRAAVHGHHVAELHRGARRHVVGAHEVAGDRVGAAELAQRRTSRRARPRHPTCRSSSSRGRHRHGFRLMPPESYMTPCRRSRDGRAVRWPRRRAIGELDHARLFGAAAVHAEQPAAAEPDQRRLVEDLDLESPVGADGHGDVGDPRGGEMGGRRVGEVPRKHRRAREAPAALRALAHGVALGGAGDERDGPRPGSCRACASAARTRSARAGCPRR